jgi:TolB protein
MGREVQEYREASMTLPPRFLLSLGLMTFAVPAHAQQPGTPAATVVAVPPLTTPDNRDASLRIAADASQLIAQDLRTTSEVVPLPPRQKDYYSYPEVTAPTFSRWRAAGAKMLVTGFVQARSDGRVTFGCYVYDVDKGREVARKGFVVAPDEWKRAAHKCSGLAYTAVTGAPGIFDTRIAYVAESGGAGPSRVKRIAIMDADGTNHAYLTAGETLVLTPRLSPKAARVAFVSFTAGKPQVRLIDVASGQQRPLVANDAISFAPRFSPDGTRVVFSTMLGSNSDIYIAGVNGGVPQRLTTAPGIDTDPSFSPDGSKIVFESDRSGSQQLYVMNADGSNQRRITFGGGWYASPEWNPDGAWIAFTRRSASGRSIGIIKPDGTAEKSLTSGPGDEGPSWAASGCELIFQRAQATGGTGLYRISLDGSEPRSVALPQGGSDPDWSGVMD